MFNEFGRKTDLEGIRRGETRLQQQRRRVEENDRVVRPDLHLIDTMSASALFALTDTDGRRW